MRALRRLVILVVLAAVALSLVRRRRPLPSGDAPIWPPLDVVVIGTPHAEPAASALTPAPPPEPIETLSAVDLVAVDVVVHPIDVAVPEAPWVGPIDGQCPAGYPVKVS